MNDWIRYANQGATRNQPLSPQLTNALSYLSKLGVTAEVFSGGQAPLGSGGRRVGTTTNHDHGNAADVRLFHGGRQLDYANPNDLPLYRQIVAQGRSNGVTSFGAGPGYMQPGTMHIGLGAPRIWGSDYTRNTAPGWLRESFHGASGGKAPTATADLFNPTPAAGQSAPLAPPQADASLLGSTPAAQSPAPLVAPQMIGTPNAVQVEPFNLAQMFLANQNEQKRQEADRQNAEQVRRAALFGGDSLFGPFA